MSRRRGWSGLSASYKSYLRRQGITREQWNAGKPLPQRTRSEAAWGRLTPRYQGRLLRQGVGREEWRAGYSGRRPPPAPSDPELFRISDRLVQGTDTAADQRALERWYSTQRVPPWFADQPGTNKAATAAVLSSQVLSPPETWRDVRMIPAPHGQPWIMSIEFDDGSTKEIAVPYWLAQDVMAWLTQESEWYEEHFGQPLDWDVTGTV
jgi:hypothetical protein